MGTANAERACVKSPGVSGAKSRRFGMSIMPMLHFWLPQSMSGAGLRPTARGIDDQRTHSCLLDSGVRGSRIGRSQNLADQFSEDKCSGAL